MNVSQKIIHARKQQGLTQEELAERANVTVRTIQRIESGDSTPRAYTLKTLAEALGTTFEALAAGPATPADASAAGAEREKHLLKMLCLSCCCYLAIPFVHFLVPLWLLRKSRIHAPAHTRFARRVVMQQVNWVIAVNGVMLLALGYNFVVARYFRSAFFAALSLAFFLHVPAERRADLAEHQAGGPFVNS